MYIMFRFPKDGIILYAELYDQGQELLEKEKGTSVLVPILGLLQLISKKDIKESYKDEINNQIPQAEKNNVEEQTTSGRLVVYGDSNCIDDSHLQKRMCYEKVYIYIYIYIYK